MYFLFSAWLTFDPDDNKSPVSVIKVASAGIHNLKTV